MELIYTKFVSLISSEPTIQTLLPLTPQVCLRIEVQGLGFSPSIKPILLPLTPPARLLVTVHLLVCLSA